MAHLRYQDATTRLELNLADGEVPAVVGFLLDLISQRVREAPTTSPAPGVAMVEEVYAGSSFGQKPPGFGHLTAAGTGVAEAVVVRVSGVPDSPEPEPEVARPSVEEPDRTTAEPVGRCESRHKGRRCYLTAGHDGRHRDAYQRWDDDAPKDDSGPLRPRVCAHDGCDVEFQPKRIDSRFHRKECMKAQLHLEAKARKAAADPGGSVQCPECPRTFKTPQALGGHMNVHSKAKLNGSAPSPAPLPVSPHTTRVEKAEVGREFHTVTSPDDRPYRCKVDGCGHPCRSQGELDSHRRAYHQADGIPPVVEVLASMSFPCPHEDCERHTRPYEDSGRLDHHRKLHHEPPPESPQQVVSNGRHHAERVG